MKCSYLNMDCTEVDTSGMTKIDCDNCIHRSRMWNKTIPQKYYLFWDGSPMSWLQMLTVTSFHKYNPEWEILVYQPSFCNGSNGVYIPDYTGTDWYPRLKEMEYVTFKTFDPDEYGIRRDVCGIQCSDLWRTQVLYHNGGMYSDFDVLWLKPMTAFTEIECKGDPRDFEAIVCMSEYVKGYHSNSNQIAEAGSGFLKDWMRRQGQVKPPYNHQSFSNIILNNAYPDLSAIKSRFPRVLVVPYNTFFPYGLYDLERLYNKTDLTPILKKNTYEIDKDVMAIHWYNGAKESKDYLNKEDYGRPCSMTTILKNEGWL